MLTRPACASYPPGLCSHPISSVVRRAQRGTGDLDPAWRDGSAEALPSARAVWAWSCLTFREEHEAGLWCFLSGAIGGIFVLEGSRDPARVTSLWTVRQTRAGFSSANKSA
jgi:hypothetical protein